LKRRFIKFVVFILIANEVIEDFLNEPPEKIREALKEFLDVFLSTLPYVLPSMHDIQHAIDFISGVILLNLLHYTMNPSEYAKLQRQVNELLQKRFI